MPLTCIKTPEWVNLSEVLKTRGQDFWVSCLAGLSVEDLPDRLATLRVEDELAQDLFSHVYYKSSNDIKADTGALFDELGLGLRKKRVTSHAVPGCIFALVNNDGPTALSQKRAQLSPDDTRLSAEERVRRTNIKFDIVGVEHFEKEANRHPGNFWLTAYSAVNTEECKKKVVTTTVEKQLVSERFGRCLLAEVPDCKPATERFSQRCGFGLRQNNVRSRAGPGCLALLLIGDGLPPLPLPSPVRKCIAVTTALAIATAATPEPKRRKMSGLDAEDVPSPVLPLAKVSSPRGPCGIRNCTCHCTPDPMASHEVATSKKSVAVAGAAPTGAEELHYMQVKVIEKRLAILLPTLPREKLDTSFVQGRLEHVMQKPEGRLDKFQLDISRVWRAFLEDTKKARVAQRAVEEID